MGDNTIQNIKQLILDTTPATPGSSAGTIYWAGTEYTISIVTGLGPVLQVGQELFTIVYNATGSTINNGTAVYPVGAVGGVPSVEEADATTHVTILGNILVTTMDISPASIGIVAGPIGKVRGVNTTPFGLGDTLWVAAGATGLLNNITNVKPPFPDYPIQIGGVSVVGSSTGVIDLAIKGQPEDTVINFWNGTFRENFDFRVTSNGTTVTGTLTPSNGHDDMTMIFSDGFTMLDTNPGATITLTPGTNSTPVLNCIYIPQATKVLTVSTSGWPVGVEFIRVAKVLLQSAAYTQTYGALRNQNINDEIQQTTTNQGHCAHIGSAIRDKIPATWLSGCQGNITLNTGPSPDDVFVTVTAGRIQQMHEQDFPSFDTETGDVFFVPNDSISPYIPESNINQLLLDANGDSLTDTTFSLVLWGAGNKTGEASQLMINLPIQGYDVGGFFGTPLGEAINDVNNYAVYDIPAEFQGTGFLIARFTFSLNPAGTVYTLEDIEDLRGKIPNLTAGGSAGGTGVTTFLGLTDAPASYSGEALNVVRVNAGETGLEFATISAGSGDVVGPASAVDENMAMFNGTTGKIIEDSLLSKSDVSAAITHRTATGAEHSYIDQSVTTTSSPTFSQPTVSALVCTGNLYGGTGASNNLELSSTTSATKGKVLSDSNMDLVSGKEYQIGGVPVLSSNTLGSGVANSSLESVGTLDTGTWEADVIEIGFGGTGSATQQGAINSLTNVSAATNEHVLTKDTATGNAVFKVIPSTGGDVSKVGTPVNNQLGVWTGDGTIEGDAALTFSGTILDVGNGQSTSATVKLDGNNSTSGATFGTMRLDNSNNNSYIKMEAYDRSGGSAIRFIGVNPSLTETILLTLDGGTQYATLVDGSQMSSNAAPVDSAGIANKKYVDDQIATYVGQRAAIWDFRTTYPGGTPSAGTCALNNATQSASTAFKIHDDDFFGNDRQGLVESVKGGDSFVISKRSDGSVIQEWRITGVSNFIDYVILDIENIYFDASLSNFDDVIVKFVKSEEKLRHAAEVTKSEMELLNGSYDREVVFNTDLNEYFYWSSANSIWYNERTHIVTNVSGVVLVHGDNVVSSATTDNAVIITTAGTNSVIGNVYTGGINNAKITIRGPVIAYMLVHNTISITRGAYVLPDTINAGYNVQATTAGAGRYGFYAETSASGSDRIVKAFMTGMEIF